jgi:lysozyme
MIVSESLHPFINDNILVEEFLNEKFDLNSIKDSAKRASILASLFLTLTSYKGDKYLPSKSEIEKTPTIQNLSNKDNITKSDINNSMEKLWNSFFTPIKQINTEILKNPFHLHISYEGINFIKNHEALSLKAYDLGDGKISIGYGHAENKSDSIYEIGDSISKADAERLFQKDVDRVQKGLRSLFKLWKKQGLNIKVSQHMWDAMVSMGYNMGMGAFRGSDIVQFIKREQYVEAAEEIPLTKASEIYPGLKDRRAEEKDLFLKNLI